MLYRIVDIVLWLAASGLIGYLFARNRNLKDKLNHVLKRAPTELDLELATFPQLLQELRRRPVSWLLLMPQWRVDEEERSFSLAALKVEGRNVPDEAAGELCRAASELICQGQGEFGENDDSWSEPGEADD
jgi:hypothetical protein